MAVIADEPDGAVPPRTVTLPGEASPERVDRALAALWGDLSRSRLQNLIRAGHLTVDGHVAADPSLKVGGGATLVLREPPPVAAEPAGEAIPLAILHEDDDLIVLDKPAGLVVHPGAGHETGTLVNALLGHCGDRLSGIGGVKRPGIVHRLDKDTSGLLVVAKTDRAHRSLADQFADHGRTGPLERAYLAFVWGSPQPSRGHVDVPLARSASHREKIGVVGPGEGRHAVTRFEVIETYPARADEPVASLVRCMLETGRTHQIRVHMAHIRHPLLGDDLYGAGFRTKAARLTEEGRDATGRLGRQALHAALLQFAHPATGAVVRFESDLPPDLAALRAALSDT